MNGETELSHLLAGMQPVLDPGHYVFCQTQDMLLARHLPARLIFAEAEGITLILSEKLAAEAGLTAEFCCRMIMLTVHSALGAVGFLALICTRLAALGIAVNPVAGFLHDHLFIPSDRADEALAELRRMSAEAASAVLGLVTDTETEPRDRLPDEPESRNTERYHTIS